LRKANNVFEEVTPTTVSTVTVKLRETPAKLVAEVNEMDTVVSVWEVTVATAPATPVATETADPLNPEPVRTMD